MRHPRVTEILSPYADFSQVPEDVLNVASDRGTRAHEAALAYAFGLWTQDIDEDIAGYVTSYKAWHDLFVIEVLAVEKELIHPRWGYVGHCDLVAVVSGYKPDPVKAVIDLKTPITSSLTWKCQGAAYREAEQMEHDDHIYTGILQLRKDGGLPKMTWIEDEAQAFAAFVGALSAYNYINQGKG